jgi:O-antigen/teichoic acid export membrane protein
LIQLLRNHPGRAGTLAGWFQQACSAGVAILLVPILLRFLPADKAGIWFSFQGFVNIANLADFGFGFAISRQVAYCLGQKDSAQAKNDFLDYGPGWTGIRRLMEHARSLYRWIILASASISILVFEGILPFTKLGPAASEYRFLWYFMAASALTMLTLSRLNSLLIGLNHLYAVRILTGLYFLAQGTAVALTAYLTASLNIMAAASFAAALANWIAVHVFVRKVAEPLREENSDLESWTKRPNLFRVAAPMGVVNFSAFMVSSIQVPLIGALLGPSAVAPFYLAQKIGQFLNMIAMQLVQPRLPVFTRLLANEDLEHGRALMGNTLLLSFFGTAAANLIFISMFQPLSQIMSGSELDLSFGIVALIALDLLLVNIATVWGQFVLASGINPFVYSTIFHGILNLCFISFFTPRFGLIAIPFSALLSGALTNYWYNPFKGARLLISLR